MEEKFLYYLGAGASANALPILKETETNRGLAKAMKSMADNIRRGKIKSEYSGFLNKAATNLDWLAEESTTFGTVDTYAKYLFLTDRNKLDNLKSTISLFFTIEQLYHKNLDNRYFIWLINILERTIFPDNIKILTWNYDFQLELAAEKFKKESLTYYNTVTKHSPPLISYYPNAGWQGLPKVEPNETSIFHLNGTAGFYFNKKADSYNSVFINRDFLSDEDFISHFVHNDNTMIDFAWEHAFAHDWKINFTRDMVENTTIMVVIGYSFPFFNREVDKAIFDKLKESGKLKKIYFQDPFLDGSFLTNQFGLENVEIVPIKKVDSFHIPFEL